MTPCPRGDRETLSEKSRHSPGDRCRYPSCLSLVLAFVVVRRKKGGEGKSPNPRDTLRVEQALSSFPQLVVVYSCHCFTTSKFVGSRLRKVNDKRQAGKSFPFVNDSTERIRPVGGRRHSHPIEANEGGGGVTRTAPVKRGRLFIADNGGTDRRGMDSRLVGDTRRLRKRGSVLLWRWIPGRSGDVVDECLPKAVR